MMNVSKYIRCLEKVCLQLLKANICIKSEQQNKIFHFALYETFNSTEKMCVFYLVYKFIEISRYPTLPVQVAEKKLTNNDMLSVFSYKVKQ